MVVERWEIVRFHRAIKWSDESGRWNYYNNDDENTFTCKYTHARKVRNSDLTFAQIIRGGIASQSVGQKKESTIFLPLIIIIVTIINRMQVSLS